MTPCRHARENRAHLGAPHVHQCASMHTHTAPATGGLRCCAWTHTQPLALAGSKQSRAHRRPGAPHSSPGTNSWGKKLLCKQRVQWSPQTGKQTLFRAVCILYEVSIETKERKAAHFTVFGSRYSPLLTTEIVQPPQRQESCPAWPGAGRGAPHPRVLPKGGDPALAPSHSSHRAGRKGRGAEQTDGPALYKKAEREDVTW